MTEPAETESESEPEPREDHSAGRRAGATARGALGPIGSAVRFVTGAFAAILVVHIVLSLLGANPLNVFTRLFAVLADALTLGLGDLFLLAGPGLQVVVSYGIPAIVWMIIGAIVVAILRAVARPRSGLR